MATTLAEMRAKLLAQENKQAGGNSGGSGDNVIFPHWNIPENTIARLRFLPDADPKNTFFWVERNLIKLPFAGVKGQPDSKPNIVQVPCMEMWGEACPILAEVRTWFKDKSLEEMGKKYWKKRSYLFQGFVRENPLADDKTPENPIRRFIISPQIFTLVKAAVMDPELENLPTDYEGGLDFTVKKTGKGGYADYNTSSWSRKETALTAKEREAIEKYGLFNLADYLPKKPGEVELRIIKEMFEASVDGEAFDLERWGAYYKPFGVGNYENTASVTTSSTTTGTSGTATTVTTTKSLPESLDDDSDEPEVAAQPVPSTKPSSQRAEDILAMIRNRPRT